MRVLLCAVISAAFTFMGRVGAQEVKFIDLTSAEPKITIRTPPSSGQQVKRNPDGSYTIQGFSQAVVIGDCGVGANDPHALKATVTWIDRLSYAEGDFMEWEVEIMNVGTVPMTLAASPNLSNLQPLDASVPFSYEETGLGFQFVMNIVWSIWRTCQFTVAIHTPALSWSSRSASGCD